MVDVETEARIGVFHPFDTVSTKPLYVLECANGCLFKLSHTAMVVLEMRWGGASFGEIATALGSAGLAAATAEEASVYYDLLKARIVQDRDAYRATPSGYTLRTPLIPQGAVEYVSSRLIWAYNGGVVAALCSFIALSLTIWQLRAPHMDNDKFTTHNFAIAYGLFFLSLLLHEFGHSSASARFGIKPGSIGFILYLTFPALYSDVTATWKISRWRRVIVDLGGTYFQLVAAALYAAIFLVWHWIPLTFAVLMILGTSVFNLNPLFKFDGYWAISDALGVPNLGKGARRMMLGMLRRVIDAKSEPDSSWPRWMPYALVVYGISTLAAWSYFVYRIVAASPRLLVALWSQGISLFHGALTWDRLFIFSGTLLSVLFLTLFVRGLALRARGLLQEYRSSHVAPAKK